MASLSDVSLDRGLPASVEAERSILGAILLDNHSYNEAAEKLRAEDFSLDSHRRIYSRMSELIDARRAVDIVTLAEELGRRKEVEAVGGVAYLASLTEGLPRPPSIEEYVRIVKDKSLSRQLINICSTAITRAADQSDEALVVLDAAESGLLEVSERGITRGFAGIPEIVRDSFGTIDNLYAQQKEVTGLATHYTQFDKMTSGLQASDLIIIAARPSMGKTAWAINIAENAAVRDGKIVAVFSLEMSKESLLRRMLASQALVSMQKIQTGFIPKADRGKLMEALERLAESRIFIDDTPAIALSEMRAKARRLQRQQGGLDLIVIDYLQLMSASSFGVGAKRYENRTQEVSAISRGLKALAEELRVPVVALSQLSRASEQRGGDKKPMLSDLRESGSIEQDADVVAFIHRDSIYNKDENGEEDPDSKNKAEIIIAKQRNRPTGSVHLAYIADCTRFENMAFGQGPGDFGLLMPTRPLWAEVSSHRLLANYKKLLGMAGSQAELMPVVKANAYGHDVSACAPLLAAAGARWLGVTSTEEGAAVRAVCPEPRILLMSGFRGEADTVIDHGLTPGFGSLGSLIYSKRLRFDDGMASGRLRSTLRSIPGCRARACGWRTLLGATGLVFGGVLPAAGSGDDPL